MTTTARARWGNDSVRVTLNGKSLVWLKDANGVRRDCGGYPHEMMNTWLYANDLKHLLHAEAGGWIRW